MLRTKKIEETKEENIIKPKGNNKALLIGVLFIFAIVTVGTVYLGYKFFNLYFFNLNVDIDGDGWPDLNIDTDADKRCNVNCDSTRNGKPDYNISYGTLKIAFFNIDTNGDKT